MLQIVVAQYHENIDWTQGLNAIVYKKGIDLPNVGREASTWLHYICTNYNNLPEYICLLQGDPFTHFPNILEWISKWEPRPLPIYFLGPRLYDNSFGSPHHWRGQIPIGTYYKEFFTNKPPRLFIFSAGAQYLFHRSRVLNKPLEWFQKLYEKSMEDPISPWVFERLWPEIFR